MKTSSYSPEQQKFLNFILGKYVKSGEKELSIEKLKKLLILKYDTLDDAKSKLGDIQEIRDTFTGFQQYLYARDVG